MPRFLRAEGDVISHLQGNSYGYEGYSPARIMTPLLAAMAVALVAAYAASDRESRGCVNPNGIVVDDRNCDSSGSYSYPHRWHYGGTYRHGFAPIGGSFTRSTSSSRGLFGGTGGHFGSGFS
jgi:hypothetical protein